MGTRILGVLLSILTVAACSLGVCQTVPQGTVFRADLDSDGDGLTDYQEHYKYSSDPFRKCSAGTKLSDGDWEQRKQFTYTITSVMRILPPVRLSDMNDDYQDARLISKDGNLHTVEVTYYPFNKNAEAIGENPNWKTDYAGMTEYLKPRPAANWDDKMRSDLIAELKQSGTDPDKLTDKALVEQVSRWVMGRFRYTNQFTAFYVYFSDGKPKVYPTLRDQFDASKPDPALTDEQMFAREILGREMFYGKVRGQCTSTAVLMATLLRSLGIPTRIVVCVPVADPNDILQVAKLTERVQNHSARFTIKRALYGGHGFVDHMFNEVYIGHHWVRLNYWRLGQNTLDGQQLGLMTHVYTCLDLSDIPLAKTWGERFARRAYLSPSLSSVNPYMLVSIRDQFGKHSRIDNPEVPELRAVTIDRLHWREEAQRLAGSQDVGRFSDILVGIVEWIPEQDYYQLQLFQERASQRFVLRAPGQPDLHAAVNGNFTFRVEGEEAREGYFHGFGLSLSPGDREKMVPGVDYKLVPMNNDTTYQWKVSDSISISVPGKKALE